MHEAPEEAERTYRILAYGIEKRNLSAPANPLITRNYSISFEPFNTSQRLNEYDGVILFQGIFESFELKTGYFESYLSHSGDTDELDKRKKEVQLLLSKGGFLCFLLNEEFIDDYKGREYLWGDLAKCHLGYSQFYRENYRQRVAHLDIKSDEFRPFLSLYGAAWSHFHHYNKGITWKILAEVSNRVVGMVINRQDYYVPTLIPDNRPEVIAEYFTLLGQAITSSHNKLQKTLPEWADQFIFQEEEGLSSEREALEYRISEIAERHEVLRRYKSILVLSGDELVGGVSKVFTDGFGIPIDGTDEYREDFKLLDGESKPMCLCEVKGTNGGVKREYINQADSHRERSKVDSEFPVLLIVNTHIKNARTVADKDQEIANEQILHAVKMNVLILRTIDLLFLLKGFLSEKLTLKEIETLLTSNCGWLKATGEEFVIVDGSSQQ